VVEELYRWLPLVEAAKHFGYRHPGSLRNRLRVLRKLGFVVDIGSPPPQYKVGDINVEDKVVLYWPNAKTALLRSDAPPTLLNPKTGKRSVKKKK